MKDDLLILFERLEKEGAVTMTEIYAMTSAHLFGVIHNIIPEKASAATVLKSVYKRIWNERVGLCQRQRAPLTYLRRLAHRFALDFKVEAGAKNLGRCPGLDLTNLDFPALKEVGLSDLDLRILQRAYLQGIPVSDIAKKEGLSPREVQNSMDAILSKILGAGS